MKRKPIVTESDHKRFWGVVDQIAKNKGISTSFLAKIAGMDATSFNKSKRISNGYYHMPNITTVMAILRACNLTWHDWARYWDAAQSKMEV